MKKWMNTIFFGSCFIVAIILETYGMIVWDGNLFSVTALGVVVLITGYLFMDAIRSRLKQGSEDAKFYFDKVLSEESEKRTERHTEIVNLQKASYTATKKNAVLLNEQFTEVLARLEALEENNSRMLQRIIELQRTSLEGQKNALNLEISYSKDNTKKILEAVKEDAQDQNLSSQLSAILLAIRENNRLFGEHMLQRESSEDKIQSFDGNTDFSEDNMPTLVLNTDYPEDNTQAFDDSTYYTKGNTLSFETSTNFKEDLSKIIEEVPDTSWQPSYKGFTEDTDFEKTEDSLGETAAFEPEAYADELYEELNNTDYTEDFLLGEAEGLLEENAPEADWSIEDEPGAEANNSIDSAEESEIKVIPLYEDPNKALTADEIAKLFASFGN